MFQLAVIATTATFCGDMNVYEDEGGAMYVASAYTFNTGDTYKNLILFTDDYTHTSRTGAMAILSAWRATQIN